MKGKQKHKLADGAVASLTVTSSSVSRGTMSTCVAGPTLRVQRRRAHQEIVDVVVIDGRAYIASLWQCGGDCDGDDVPGVSSACLQQLWPETPMEYSNGMQRPKLAS